MSIKEVKELPLTQRERYDSYRSMIRADLEEAIRNRISTFEFEGDYNYKYLAQYAREEAGRLFTFRVYRDASKRVKQELASKFPENKYIFPESEFKYKNRYIKIRTKKGEDRIHVYGQIDFEFADTFCEILLKDTEAKYKELSERKKRERA